MVENSRIFWNMEEEKEEDYYDGLDPET